MSRVTAADFRLAAQRANGRSALKPGSLTGAVVTQHPTRAHARAHVDAAACAPIFARVRWDRAFTRGSY